MLTIKVNNKQITIDKRNGVFVINSDFKESEHPRDEDGRFTTGSGAEKKPENIGQQQPLPYSQSSIKKMLKDPYKNKEKIIDAYENHFEEVAGSMRAELETVAVAWGAKKKEKTEKEKKADFLSERNLQRLKNNPKAHPLEIKEVVEKYIDDIPTEYKGFFKKENEKNKAKAEITKKIDDLKKQRENLKLPKKITAEHFSKWLRENDIGVQERIADTGSKYFWFSNPNDPEGDKVRVSIRDHFQHSAEHVRPDFDLMIDKDNNWQDTLAYMIKKYNLTKGSFAKKVLRYNDLLEEEDDIKKKNKEL